MKIKLFHGEIIMYFYPNKLCPKKFLPEIKWMNLIKQKH